MCSLMIRIKYAVLLWTQSASTIWYGKYMSNINGANKFLAQSNLGSVESLVFIWKEVFSNFFLVPIF